MTIKENDLLRPTATSAQSYQVYSIRGESVYLYNPITGSVNPRYLREFKGWVVERDFEIVGTM